MLSIIQYESHNLENTTLLETTLNALWSLSDACEKTCINFVNENGLKIYTNLIEKYETKADVMTCMLGLIVNNLSFDIFGFLMFLLYY